MSASLESAIEKVHSVADEICVNQMYLWPDFRHDEPDPAAFFRKRKIKFDGVLFIRYPVKATFRPISAAQIAKEEKSLGVKLPSDYKKLLQTFGEFHLPGSAMITLDGPAQALKTTRDCWCYEGQPLSALAISSYCNSADGNSIGYVRKGNTFGPSLHEFNHELWRKDANPSLWAKKLSDSLADFVLEYLSRDS